LMQYEPLKSNLKVLTMMQELVLVVEKIFFIIESL
jgi:hypothetical protein